MRIIEHIEHQVHLFLSAALAAFSLERLRAMLIENRSRTGAKSVCKSGLITYIRYKESL